MYIYARVFIDLAILLCARIVVLLWFYTLQFWRVLIQTVVTPVAADNARTTDYYCICSFFDYTLLLFACFDSAIRC